VPGTLVRQSGHLTYLIKVKENQIGKRHIDDLHQRDDTPKNLLKSDNRLDSECGLDENIFDNMSMTDDGYVPDVSSSERTETKCYPERTLLPPDCLIH